MTEPTTTYLFEAKVNYSTTKFHKFLTNKRIVTSSSGKQIINCRKNLQEALKIRRLVIVEAIYMNTG